MVCIPLGESVESSCPITSMTFDLESLFEYERSLYEPIKGIDGKGLLYISRKVMQHGIENVRLSPGSPCMDSAETNSPSN